MKAKFICFVLGGVGLILGFLAALMAISLGFWVIDEFTHLDFPFSLLTAAPGLALVTGLLLGGFLSHRYSQRAGIAWNFGPGTKIAARVLLVLYLVTWAVGAPRIQTENTRDALEEWRKIHQGQNTADLSDGLPYIQTFVAVPTLPFLVASYHEYQIAGLNGAGGWDIQVWYLVGVKRLFFLRLWIS